MSLANYPRLLFVTAFLYDRNKNLYGAVSLPLTAPNYIELVIWNNIYFRYESHNEHNNSITYIEVNGYYTVQTGDLHDRRTSLGN